jgi:hypothetical protein
MWYCVAAILFIAVLGFVSNSLGLVSFAFFSPKVEQVRYNTFKQSQSYNDGMIRDLEQLKLQYITALPEQKVALRGIIIHRFSVYDTNALPQDLQAFYYSITQGVQQ